MVCPLPHCQLSETIEAPCVVGIVTPFSVTVNPLIVGVNKVKVGGVFVGVGVCVGVGDGFAVGVGIGGDVKVTEELVLIEPHAAETEAVPTWVEVSLTIAAPPLPGAVTPRKQKECRYLL